MCEHCKERNYYMVDLSKDQEKNPYEGIQCTGVDEKSCGKEVEITVYEWRVDEHLCFRHAEEEKENLDRGLADLYKSMGLETSQRLRPVKTSENCYRCEKEGVTQEASWANFTLEPYDFCKDCALAFTAPTVQ